MLKGAVRILIAGDSPISRDGLRKLLEAEPGFQIVGEAGDAVEALQQVRHIQPDLLLLHATMTDVGAQEFLEALRADSHVPPTILLTASTDTKQLLTALECGARGVVLKESTTAMLFKSIRCVLKGQYWLGRDQVGDVVQSMCRLRSELDARGPHNGFGLTRRELEMVSAVATGASNKVIARRLSLSEETVKRHLSNISNKLGVFSRVELVVFAINHGLVKNAAPHPTSSPKRARALKVS